jgi:methionine-rich copper-binding protein CopC
LIFVQGIPFDAARVDADPAEIEMYLDEIEELVVDFPVVTIVNLDEPAIANGSIHTGKRWLSQQNLPVTKSKCL